MLETMNYYVEELRKGEAHLRETGNLKEITILDTTVTCIFDIQLGAVNAPMQDILDSIIYELSTVTLPMDTGLFWYYVGASVDGGHTDHTEVKGELSKLLDGYSAMVGYNITLTNFKEYVATVCKPNTKLPDNLSVNDFHQVLELIHIIKDGDNFKVNDGTTEMANSNHSVQFKVYSLIYNNLCVVEEGVE